MQSPPGEPKIRVTEEEWTDLWKRLRVLIYGKYGSLRDQLDLDGFIHEAIIDVCTGRRTWPPREKPGAKNQVTLLIFLFQTVRGKISNHLQKERRKTSLETVSEEVFADSAIPWLVHDETQLTRAAYSELCDRLLELATGDEELGRILNILIAEPDLKPRQIAAILRIHPRKVRAAQKRLKRKADVLRLEWSGV